MASLLLGFLISTSYAINDDSISDATLNGAIPPTGTELTWYALRSGDWTDWETWTLDPSGNLPNNPGNDIPGTDDNIVIHSGKTVNIHQVDGIL
ncbi:MAG: hypothetical protein MI866_16310, partial [Bacteroidales bacterium]|nr:hypothetical protein [Bacteroidales bacterium]